MRLFSKMMELFVVRLFRQLNQMTVVVLCSAFCFKALLVCIQLLKQYKKLLLKTKDANLNFFRFFRNQFVFFCLKFFSWCFSIFVESNILVFSCSACFIQKSKWVSRNNSRQYFVSRVQVNNKTKCN